ncbi:MAG: GNAT family N-acetyltransferase, partial [Gammaproteobacteria bacterium]
RLVGDGVYVIQLVDLIVSKKYRKQGIAKNLVNSILAGYFNQREKGAVMLIDGSGIKNLYESLDFRSAPNEMVFYM